MISVDRNLALEMTRVTEAAALASAVWMGKGDTRSAVNSAVDAMHKIFRSISIKGTIILGQGPKNIVDKLYLGETIGSAEEPEIDIALKPLECINSVAYGRTNALSVIALTPKNNIMPVPDVYMEKIAVGSDAASVIDLNLSLEDNIKNIAKAKKYSITDLTAAVLDRERHSEIIDRLRKLGCRLHLLPDGDLSAAIAAAMPGTGIDVLVGIGGAREGVLTAAALRCIGGEMHARLLPQKKENSKSEIDLSKINTDQIYKSADLTAGENIMFAATGITDGDILNGVRYRSDGATTNSLVLRSISKTRRFLITEHYFENQPSY